MDHVLVAFVLLIQTPSSAAWIPVEVFMTRLLCYERTAEIMAEQRESGRYEYITGMRCVRFESAPTWKEGDR